MNVVCKAFTALNNSATAQSQNSWNMEIKSTERIAFQKARKKWRKLNKGDFVIGIELYRKG